MAWDIFSLGLLGCLALLLLAAGIEDARSRNIANTKTAAIALLAPLWWVATGIDLWPGMAIQFGVALIVFAFFCGAFHFGQMGGGDVKLIGALALWLPATLLLTTLLIMAIVGGLITVVMMIERKIKRNEGVVEIPYGVAIAIAGLLSLREPLLNHFS